MLEEMSAKEFQKWQQFYRVEPFGQMRDEYRNALLVSTLANIHAAKGKKYRLEDFVLFSDKKKSDGMTREDVEAFRSRMLAFTKRQEIREQRANA